MKRPLLKNLLTAGIPAGLGISLLAGCSSHTQQVLTITQKPYEKKSYETVYVQQGDMQPDIHLDLRLENYEEITYSAVKEGLKLDEIHVSVGERVKKGDILVSFESDEIRREISEYEDDKKQKELLVEHYEKLMKIDETMDYQEDVKMLREDIRVVELYIEQSKNMLAQYQIVAKEDGVIINLSDYLQNGVVKPGKTLLTEACTTGRYEASAAQEDGLAVGDIYTAAGKKSEYELRLIDRTEETLIFEPVSEITPLAGDEVLKLTVGKPEMKDVVYVDCQAVYTIAGRDGKEDTYCVYVMDENGYQRGIFVTPGECIGDNMIITEGLSAGEKVVIR